MTGECLRRPDPLQRVGRSLRGWRVELAFALKTPTLCHGLLLVSDKNTGEMYSEEDVSLLRLLVEHAGIALENSRYAHALQQLNAELEQRVAARTRELSEAVTQLESLNRSLAAHQALLSSAVEILPLPLFFIAADGGIVLRNRAFTEFIQHEQLTDIHQVQLLDSVTGELLPDEQRPSFQALHGQVSPRLNADSCCREKKATGHLLCLPGVGG